MLCDTIPLPNGTRVLLPKISRVKSDNLEWYVDALQDILPCNALVSVQRWALEQSEAYDTSVEYWYAVLIAAAAHAAHMNEEDFVQNARTNSHLQGYLF